MELVIRTDSGGGTHEFGRLACRPRPVAGLRVGMAITATIRQAFLKVPASAWTPAVEPDGDIRDGAWVAEGRRLNTRWPWRSLWVTHRPAPAAPNTEVAR